MLTEQEKIQLSGNAKFGDRIVIAGKQVWAGLGNRAGLHSYAEVVLKERWEKSSKLFLKRLDEYTEGRIEIYRFQNITRDRGRWIRINVFK